MCIKLYIIIFPRGYFIPRIKVCSFFLSFFLLSPSLYLRYILSNILRKNIKERSFQFEQWRHRQAHASRRELRASTSYGGCHLLRRCRVHRPSRFAPTPDPARYYRSTRALFYRAEDRVAPALIETRRVHSAVITRAASEARSFILARDRATVSFTSRRRRRSQRKIMVSATQRSRLRGSGGRSSRMPDLAAIRFNRDCAVPRCLKFEIVRHVTC